MLLSSSTCYLAVVHVTYVTSFSNVGRVIYPSWGKTRRKFQGRRGCTATYQRVREDVAIVDICMVVLGSIALFPLHARGSSL